MCTENLLTFQCHNVKGVSKKMSVKDICWGQNSASEYQIFTIIHNYCFYYVFTIIMSTMAGNLSRDVGWLRLIVEQVGSEWEQMFGSIESKNVSENLPQAKLRQTNW